MLTWVEADADMYAHIQVIVDKALLTIDMSKGRRHKCWHVRTLTCKYSQCKYMSIDAL